MSTILLMCKSTRDRLGWIRANGGAGANIVPIMSGKMPPTHTLLGHTYHLMQTPAFAASPDKDVEDWSQSLTHTKNDLRVLIVDGKSMLVEDMEIRVTMDSSGVEPVVRPTVPNLRVFGWFRPHNNVKDYHFIAAGLDSNMSQDTSVDGSAVTFSLLGPVIVLSESEVAGHG